VTHNLHAGNIRGGAVGEIASYLSPEGLALSPLNYVQNFKLVGGGFKIIFQLPLSQIGYWNLAKESPVWANTLSTLLTCGSSSCVPYSKL